MLSKNYSSLLKQHQPLLRFYLKLTLFIAGVIFLIPNILFAQPKLNEGLLRFQEITNYGNASLDVIIGRIIKIVLSFQGLILVILIIIAGFYWMTSGGNEEKIKGAKNMIVSAIIGMAIISLSYVLANFFLQKLIEISS